MFGSGLFRRTFDAMNDPGRAESAKGDTQARAQVGWK
jgi:hypothetical protein